MGIRAWPSLSSKLPTLAGPKSRDLSLSDVGSQTVQKGSCSKGVLVVVLNSPSPQVVFPGNSSQTIKVKVPPRATAATAMMENAQWPGRGASHLKSGPS